MSSIEWTEMTWNPVVGCKWASPGCDHCYAATMSRRLEAMGKPDYQGLTTRKHFNGVVRTLEHKLGVPLKRKKPTTWFVNSMSDLFHDDVPFDFIDRVFAVMAMCPHHTFQVLTKRAERMSEYVAVLGRSFYRLNEAGLSLGLAFEFEGIPLVPWPIPNVWLGVSVEDQQRADERISHLLKTPAAVRFLSCEPLLGPIDLEQAVVCSCGDHGLRCLGCGKTNIDWVIVGGESGPGARPMDPDWVRSIRDQCVDAGVPFFFKQWGAWAPLSGWHVMVKSGNYAFLPDGTKVVPDHDGREYHVWPCPPGGEDLEHDDFSMLRVGKKKAGRLLDGREWNEMPEIRSQEVT